MIRKLIERPIAVTMIVTALVILGVVALRLLPVSLMPQIDIPQITVKVTAPNTSARELQNMVIAPLRIALMQAPYLNRFETTAKNGVATIFLEFDYGTDVDYTFIDVNERIDKAMPLLPKEIGRPMVVKASATDIPVFFLNLTLREELKGEDSQMVELSSFASNVIARRIEQLDQVALVDVSGIQHSQLTVVPDLDKLKSMGQTPELIYDAIRNSNVHLGNLTIRDGQYSYNVRFNSTNQSKGDIEQIKLNIGGRIYTLKDLAQVRFEPRSRGEFVRSNGREAIAMAIIKQPQARMDELQDAIEELREQMERDYPDLELSITRDQTALLDYSIDNMKSNLLIGGVLAILVLFLFMQDFRTPLLVMITVPVSLMVSMLMFFIFGISINIISLSGLVLGLGMMIDNSIIVIDNISQRWDRGESLSQAVAQGTSEVFAPLLSSLLTTCAVFLPLVFLNGMAGAMFYDQAMAVAIGLVSSLAVAMLLIPVYYYLLYRTRTRRTGLSRTPSRISSIDVYYEQSLKWVFRHQIVLWCLAGLIVLSGAFAVWAIERQSLPKVEQSDVMVMIDWNHPISVRENDRRTLLLMEACCKKADQKTSMCGQNTFTLGHTSENSKEQAQLYLHFANSEDLTGTVDDIRQYMTRNYPQAIMRQMPAGNIFNMIFRSNNSVPLVAHLRSANGMPTQPDKLNLLLSAIRDTLPQVFIQPVQWQENRVLYFNHELMMLYKVNSEDVYRELKQAFNQQDLIQIESDRVTIPVVLGSDQQNLDKVLAQTFVQSTDSVAIPLGLFIRKSADRELNSIISGADGPYYPLELRVKNEEVLQTVEKIKSAVAANADFEVSFAGEWYQSRELIRQLVLVLLVSLVLLYLILASQFESIGQPLIILSEVLIDFLGAVLLLWLCGQSLNLMSMIGLIVMSGIVINDSILKVDTFNRLRGGGMSPLRAVMVGGHRRFKPILMTALTTIIAVVPLLFSNGMGADLQRPMSLAIIGGMLVGTMFSVYGIPVIYYHVYRHRACKVHMKS